MDGVTCHEIWKIASSKNSIVVMMEAVGVEGKGSNPGGTLFTNEHIFIFFFKDVTC